MSTELQTDERTQLPGLSGTTVCAAFQLVARACADRPALRTRGDAQIITWREYADRVEAIAGGLAGLGVGRGDTVATLLLNRPEFHLVDMAAVHLGAVPFGIYNTSPPAEVARRLDNADARVVLTETAFLPLVRAACEIDRRVEHVIVIDGDASDGLTLAEVEAAPAAGFDFAARWRAVTPDDLVTIIYTSGTTGPPKGAQWTHANVMAQLRGWSRVHPLPTRGISYLPLAHAGERMICHYMPLGRGATVTCCSDYRAMLDDVVEFHPDFLVSVPRMWVKLKAAIMDMIAALPEPDRARHTEAVTLGERVVTLTQSGEPVPDDLRARHEAALPALRAELLSRFGLDRIAVTVIGSAPPPPDVLLFFHAVGVPLMEAWGQTEATFCATVGAGIDDFRLGTAGKPLPNVELRLAGASVGSATEPAGSAGEPSAGEILLRGPTVMQGYRKDPAATAAAIDADGWLATGDIGRIDADGYLTIIDRKKELIINLAGKNMSPAMIELAIKRASPLIAQCVAIGNGRPYNVALITLDRPETEEYLRARGERVPFETAASHGVILKKLERAVAHGNTQLSRVEQIKKFRVLPGEWQPDSDLLTPTAKVKRKGVDATYAREIDALYR